MDSTRDEENEYSTIDDDQESTNLTSRRSSEGNTYEEPSSAVKRKQKAVGETLRLVKKEEEKKQNSLESIICSIRFKIGLLILFILLTSALSLLFFLYARHGADIGEAKNNASVDELKATIASRDVDINRLKNKINELAPEQTSVMLLGGLHEYMTDSTTIYNSMEKNWKKCKLTLPSTLTNHGAALLNNEIYIFGGNDRTIKEDLKSLYKLGADNKWERMADMNEKRTGISQSSIVFNSEIWVIGGANEGGFIINRVNILKSVEKFNPKTKKWTKMPELNESRMAAAATVVDGKIYVSGGWDGWKTKISVEVYDPEKGEWEIFNLSMPHAVGSHILIRNNSHLIAIGGDLSMQGPTNKVWKMDVLDPKREWKKMPFLRQRRYFPGAVIIADELMVFGGSINDTNRIDSVEIFDGVEWKNGAPLPEKRTAFAYIPLTYALERLFLKRFC